MVYFGAHLRYSDALILKFCMTQCEVPMIYSQWPSIDFVRRLLIAASRCCALSRLSACLYAEFYEGGGATVVYLCFIGEQI